MAPSLDTLPFDILRPIMEDLVFEDWARLMQLNKAFHANIEPQLMAIDHVRHLFMRDACRKGQMQAVHKALSFGADASLVNVSRRARRPFSRNQGPTRKTNSILVPSLQLAAAGNHKDVFQILLDQGAQFTHPDADPKSVKRLLQRLFDPYKPDLLLLCLQAGRKEEIPAFQDHLDQTLLHAMRLSLSIDQIKVWVGLGSDPRTLFDKFDPERPRREASTRTLFPHFDSALSLAMIRGDEHILNVFLTCGLDMASTRAASGSKLRHHAVLLYTAVLSTLRYRDLRMMDVCLDLGIDINMDIGRVLWRCPRLDHPRHSQPCPPLPTHQTVLGIYLQTIDTSIGTENGKLSASEGLSYLLRQGARDETEDPFKQSKYSLLEFFWREKPKHLALLQEQKNIMINMLISAGAGPPFLSLFLRDFLKDGSTYAEQPSPEELRTIASRWDDTMDLLLDNNPFKQRESFLSDLLRQFCQDLMELRTVDHKSKGFSQSILDPLIIRKLLRRGAVFDRFESAYEDSALLSSRVAGYYVNTALTLHPSVDRDCAFCEYSNSLVDLIETVIRLGANPHVPDNQGRTFYSVISSSLDGPDSEGAHFDALRDVFRSLDGTSQPMEARQTWNPISDWVFAGMDNATM